MKQHKSIVNGSVKDWPPAVLIYTDGASRGNPGLSSIGIVVYDEQGKALYEEATLLGVQTNNYAEYSAVLKALKLSCKNKVQSLVLKSDSQLLVNQLSGKYKVRSPNIRSLHQVCRKYSEQILSVQFQHIPREQNTKADALANLILDSYS